MGDSIELPWQNIVVNRGSVAKRWQMSWRLHEAQVADRLPVSMPFQLYGLKLLSGWIELLNWSRSLNGRMHGGIDPGGRGLFHRNYGAPHSLDILRILSDHVVSLLQAVTFHSLRLEDVPSGLKKRWHVSIFIQNFGWEVQLVCLILWRFVVRHPVKWWLVVLRVFWWTCSLFLISYVDLLLNHFVEDAEKRFVLILVVEAESVRWPKDNHDRNFNKVSNLTYFSVKVFLPDLILVWFKGINPSLGTPLILIYFYRF